MEIDSVFNEVYDATYRKCLIYITCKCKNVEDVPDILQDTYMSLYKILLKKGVDHLNNPEAYVIRVAKSNISKYYTLQDKLKRIVPIFSNDDFDEDYNSIGLEYNSMHFDMDKELIDSSMLDEIWDFVKSKPQSVQKVFYLFYYADMTINQIAKELNLNESTVKTRLYRTTKEVRVKFPRGGEV